MQCDSRYGGLARWYVFAELKPRPFPELLPGAKPTFEPVRAYAATGRQNANLPLPARENPATLRQVRERQCRTANARRRKERRELRRRQR